jgi:hypothetical protein
MQQTDDTRRGQTHQGDPHGLGAEPPHSYRTRAGWGLVDNDGQGDQDQDQDDDADQLAAWEADGGQPLD